MSQWSRCASCSDVVETIIVGLGEGNTTLKDAENDALGEG